VKREPLVYAVLLVAALALAFRSWTHEDQSQFKAGSFELWHEQPDAIVSIDYSEPGQHLVMQRLGPKDAPYLWATEDTSAFRMDEGTSRRLLEALAAPRAERDLGTADARARRAYGLDTSRTRVVVRSRSASRELLIGMNTVDRTGDWYALEPRSGHVYVMPALQLPPLTGAAQMLLERRLHAFSSDSVGTVSVRSADRTVARRRIVAADRTAPGMARASWVPLSGAAQPDTAFATFMMDLNGAAAASYAARENPRAMPLVLRVDYADNQGRAQGFLELFQRPGTDGKAEYFARTELTGTLVRLYPGLGDALTTAARGL
jgi:hypothetical protein